MTTVLLPDPISFRTTRYRCPYCPRTSSSKARSRQHTARCWCNPAAMGCKTCEHYDLDPGGPPCFPEWHCSCNEGSEGCRLGVSLDGRAQCDNCVAGYVGHADLGEVCPKCGGNYEPVKPGPIVACSKWESNAGEAS